MKQRPYSYFLFAFAALAGLVVLLGYWISWPVLIDVRQLLVRWAAILAAVAILVGILNLLSIHWLRISRPKPGGIYSLALMIAFILTLLVVLVDTPTGSWSLWVFRYIQLPVEAALLSLLAVVLVVAVIRLIALRIDWFVYVFVGTAILILVGSTYLVGYDFPALIALHDWILQVPVLAGARGILLGVGLGVVAVGVRILLGANWPYEG